MILITGGKGQLGSALATLLERKGEIFEALCGDELDVTNPVAVRGVLESLRPSFVINCAAYNEVDKAEEEPHRAIAVNALGVRNLALVCGEMGVPLMHISTDYVFAGDSPVPYTIAHQPCPLGTYGRSKLLGEQLLTTLCPRYYLVRVSWVFGKGERNFLHKVFQWAKSRDVLEIVDDQISAPSYAPHLADALLQLADTGAYGLYHLRNQGECSRYQWAAYALKKAGWPGQVTPVPSSTFPTPAKRPACSVLDVYPLDEMLNYSMPTWQEATDQWLKEEGYL
jgi:dTDP-4-dehydrorhamnose reductase